MDDLGFLAEKDGFRYLVKDLRTVTEMLHEQYPGLPLVLLGHSMGSFITRLYAAEYSDGVNAYIFEGTDGSNPQSAISLLLINTLSFFKGERYRSELIKNISFMGYLSRIEDHPTGSEWVTSDPQKLDEYVHDPYCAFTFTLSGYRDLVKCLDIVLKRSWADRLRNDLPYLLVSGEEDPVGDFGHGVKRVYEMMKDAGCDRTEMRLYPGQRHELHNETKRETFFRDILEWLDKTLGF
jgi:alpha-beta hydrolase superfamily lysophospholipase